MRGDKLYELLDVLDDDLVLESADVRRKKWRFRLAVVLSVVLILAVVYWVATYPVRHPPTNIGGTPGVVQNEIYYAYAGSGFPLPGEVAVPRGIFRYVPGKGKELLVSAKEKKMDILFRSWDVNSHGLYYTDGATLWRMDLETGEETVLYQCQGAVAPVEQALEEEGFFKLLWEIVTRQKTDEELEALSQPVNEDKPYFILGKLTEDRVSVNLYNAPGGDQCVTLDGHTGEVLGQDALRNDHTYTVSAGNRVFQLVRKPLPQGETVYEPLLEQDSYTGTYYWYDVLENGVSVLPKGWRTESSSWKELDGVLLLYCWRARAADEDGWPEDCYYLLTSDGGAYPFEKDHGDLWRDPLTVADGWLYYACQRPREGYSSWITDLMARNLKTGEDYLVKEGAYIREAVTDGKWLYACAGGVTGKTDCYRIEFTDDGVPCGLTLIEEDI